PSHQAFGGARTPHATDRTGRGRALGQRPPQQHEKSSRHCRAASAARRVGRKAPQGKPPSSAQDLHMSHSEIHAVRQLLRSRPRPTGFAERPERVDAIGSTSPVAADIKLEATDAGGVAAEWSLAPGSDRSRVLLFFHGGGYCSGSIVSHRGMVTEVGRAARVRTLAVAYRLAPEHPLPAALEDGRAAYGFLLDHGIAASHIPPPPPPPRSAPPLPPL